MWGNDAFDRTKQWAKEVSEGAHEGKPNETRWRNSGREMWDQANLGDVRLGEYLTGSQPFTGH
jgi:hypothetical protein